MPLISLGSFLLSFLQLELRLKLQWTRHYSEQEKQESAASRKNRKDRSHIASLKYRQNT